MTFRIPIGNSAAVAGYQSTVLTCRCDERIRNQTVPPALSFEDNLDDLADDAPSAWGIGDEMSNVLNFGNGVSGTRRQACGSKDRHVRQIVTHVTDLTFRKAELTNQCTEGRDFVFVALENMHNSE